MPRKLSAHIRNQWMGAIALFLALSGGTAYALAGSNTVFSDDIVNGQVKAEDLGASSVTSAKIGTGQVANPDLAPGAVTGAQVKDGSLTASDVSGVNDRCPRLMTQVQEVLCIDDDYRGAGTWGRAVNACAAAGLRLPTPTELFLAYRNGRLLEDPPLSVWTDTPSSTSTAYGQVPVTHAIQLDTGTGEMSRWSMSSIEFFYCVGPLSDNYR